jgi:hypothetical protein
MRSSMTASSPTSPLGDSIETFVRREDAERFIEEVRGDDPDLASHLGIEERELETGARNSRLARGTRDWRAELATGHRRQGPREPSRAELSRRGHAEEPC